MRKSTALIYALFLMIIMNGCGGGSTSAANSKIYDVPPGLALSDTHIGGSLQGIALALSKTVSTIAGTASTAGSVDGVQSAASFNQPVGITTDGNYLYVADLKSNIIRKINLSDNTVTKLAGSGIAGYTDGIGTAATFNAPTAITYSHSDNCLYVADTGNNMIRKIDQTGVVTYVAGSTTGVPGAVDSKTAPADVRFNQPTGITTDGVNLYVTDSGNHTIRMINIASKAVTTLAGTPGTAGSADGAQSVARFNQPARITTDGKHLYVTDFLNRTIRKVDILSGDVRTIAGISGPLDSAGNIADSSDGTGATARFYQPNGITTDGINLYVTDSYNNSIRKIVISSGEVTTLISGTGAAPGSTDGPSVTARFNTPIGITTDGMALFVADSGNHTIRKIE